MIIESVTKKAEPITELIHEEGRPADGGDWSKYKRVVVKIEPTFNAREAALKADIKLREMGVKK